MLVIFFTYTYHLSKRKVPTDGTEERVRREDNKLKGYILLALAGVTGVIASTYFIVDSTSNIAEIIGVPKILIGATISLWKHRWKLFHKPNIDFGNPPNRIATRREHEGFLGFDNIFPDGQPLFMVLPNFWKDGTERGSNSAVSTSGISGLELIWVLNLPGPPLMATVVSIPYLICK